MTEDMALMPSVRCVLLGREEAERVLTESYRSGRMPHAWILAGPRGTGKATLAYRAARMVLAGSASMDMDEAHPVFRRVAAGSHADLLALGSDAEQGGSIGVDEARGVGAFLALTPAESDWRVVIIDGADDMNVNAANAILKLLEEPPSRALLLLVSHNPGALLPTIRSRCRMLRLPPLSPEAFLQAAQPLLPEAPPGDLAALAVLSDHSPGAALALWHAQGLQHYASLIDLAGSLPSLNAEKALALAAQAEGAKAAPARRALVHCLLMLLRRIALRSALGRLEQEIVAGEKERLEALASRRGPAAWAGLWEEAGRKCRDAERLYLDFRPVLLSLFQDMQTLTAQESRA